jgi:hypothetical protein
MDDFDHDVIPQLFRNDDLAFLSKIERVAELRMPDCIRANWANLILYPSMLGG